MRRYSPPRAEPGASSAAAGQASWAVNSTGPLAAPRVSAQTETAITRTMPARQPLKAPPRSTRRMAARGRVATDQQLSSPLVCIEPHAPPTARSDGSAGFRGSYSPTRNGGERRLEAVPPGPASAPRPARHAGPPPHQAHRVVHHPSSERQPTRSSSLRNADPAQGGERSADAEALHRLLVEARSENASLRRTATALHRQVGASAEREEQLRGQVEALRRDLDAAESRAAAARADHEVELERAAEDIRDDLRRARQESRRDAARARALERELQGSRAACERAEQRAASLAAHAHHLEQELAAARGEGASSSVASETTSQHRHPHPTIDVDAAEEGGTGLVQEPDASAGVDERTAALSRALSAPSDDWLEGDGELEEAEEAVSRAVGRGTTTGPPSPSWATAGGQGTALASVGVPLSPTACPTFHVSFQPRAPAAVAPFVPAAEARGKGKSGAGFWAVRSFRPEWGASIVAALPLRAPRVAAWTQRQLHAASAHDAADILADGGPDARAAATSLVRDFLHIDLRLPGPSRAGQMPSLALVLAPASATRDGHGAEPSVEQEDVIPSALVDPICAARVLRAADTGQVVCAAVFTRDASRAPPDPEPAERKRDAEWGAAAKGTHGSADIAHEPAAQKPASPASNDSQGPVLPPPSGSDAPPPAPSAPPSLDKSCDRAAPGWLARGAGRVPPLGALAVLTVRAAPSGTEARPSLCVDAYVQSWGSSATGKEEEEEEEEEGEAPVCVLSLPTALAIAAEAEGESGTVSADRASAVASAFLDALERRGEDEGEVEVEEGAFSMDAFLAALRARACLRPGELSLDTRHLPTLPIPAQQAFRRRATPLLRPARAATTATAAPSADSPAQDQDGILGRQMTLIPPAGALTAVTVRARLDDAGRVALHCEADLPGVAPLPVGERDALSAVLLRLARLREHREEGGAEAGGEDVEVAMRAVGAAAGPSAWRHALRQAVGSGGAEGTVAAPTTPSHARGLLFRSVLDALRLTGDGGQCALALEVSHAAVRASQRRSAASARSADDDSGAVLLRKEGVTLQPGGRGGMASGGSSGRKRRASKGGALVVMSQELRRGGVDDTPSSSSSWHLHTEAYDPQRKHSISGQVGAEPLRRFNAALPLVADQDMEATPAPIAAGHTVPPAWVALACAVEERAAWNPPPREGGAGEGRQPRGAHAGTVPHGASLAVDLASPRRVALWRGGATLCEDDPPARVQVALEFPVAERGGELPLPPRCVADAYMPATMRRAAAATPVATLLPDRFPAGGEGERRLREACAEAERRRLAGGQAEDTEEAGAFLLQEVASEAVARLQLQGGDGGERELVFTRRK